MLTSINTLRIKSIETQTDTGGFNTGFSEICIMRYRSTLNARLEFAHPEGKVFSWLEISAKGLSEDYMVSMRDCIEAFINKDFETRLQVSSGQSCNIDRSQIHELVIEIQDPLLRKLFADIFDIKNWSVHDKTLTC